MTVTYDTSQSTNTGAIASTIFTVPITPSTDPSRCLFAFMLSRAAVDTTVIVGLAGSTATASDNFTFLGEDVAGTDWMMAFYYLAPSTAALTIQFEALTALDTSWAVVANYFNVDQTAPADTILFSTGTSTADTLDPNIIDTDGVVLDVFFTPSTTATIAANAGGTERINSQGLALTIGLSDEIPATTPENSGWAASASVPWVHMATGVLSTSATTSVTLTGTMASSDIAGAFTNRNLIAKTGGITPAGTFTNKNSIAKTGTMASTDMEGSITRRNLLSLSGGITPTGAIDIVLRRIYKILFGLASAVGVKFGMDTDNDATFGVGGANAANLGQSGATSDNAARFDTDSFGNQIGPP